MLHEIDDRVHVPQLTYEQMKYIAFGVWIDSKDFLPSTGYYYCFVDRGPKDDRSVVGIGETLPLPEMVQLFFNDGVKLWQDDTDTKDKPWFDSPVLKWSKLPGYPQDMREPSRWQKREAIIKEHSVDLYNSIIGNRDINPIIEEIGSKLKSI